MKKLIGLGLLMLTGLTAFAAPARTVAVKKTAYVAAHKHGRKTMRRGVKKTHARFTRQRFVR
jgi:hypothetical protein